MLSRVVLIFVLVSNIFCSRLGSKRNGFRTNDKVIENMITMDVLEFLEFYNYHGEKHRITTEDGYILNMFRIPPSKNCSGQPQKPPVVIAHGLLSSSFDWLYFAPINSIACILADQCYDVWLTNSRGNYESKEHTILSSQDDRYWKFSWHEMGQFDLPAFFKYIKDVTGKQKLFYIGHSQGCTQFFVFCSLYPKQCKDTVIEMYALAPGIYMEHSISPTFRWLTSQYLMTMKILGDQNWHDFMPLSKVSQELQGKACLTRLAESTAMCSNFLFAVCGYDFEQLNSTMLPVIVAHLPAGSSVYQLIHWGQLLHSEEFQMFDHGYIENMFRYQSVTPPRYPIEKITVPIHIFYGDNDWLVSVRGVKKIHRIVKTSTLHHVPFKNFNHMDFMLAKDVKKLVYDPVSDLIKKATAGLSKRRRKNRRN